MKKQKSIRKHLSIFFVTVFLLGNMPFSVFSAEDISNEAGTESIAVETMEQDAQPEIPQEDVPISSPEEADVQTDNSEDATDLPVITGGNEAKTDEEITEPAGQPEQAPPVVLSEPDDIDTGVGAAQSNSPAELFNGWLVFRKEAMVVKEVLISPEVPFELENIPDIPPGGENTEPVGWALVKDGVSSDTAFDFTLENINTLVADEEGKVHFEALYMPTGEENPDDEDPTLVVVTYIFPDGRKETKEVTINETTDHIAVNAADYGMAVFRGWFTSPNPADNEYPFDFGTPITADTTLYAVCSDTYVISYKNQDGVVIQTNLLKPGQRIYGPTESTINQINPPEGSRLSHWYDEKTPDVPYHFGLDTSVATGDITFCPAFTDTHLVIFSSVGTEVAYQTVSHGGTAEKPGNPSRAGYTFAHWYVSGADENIAFDFATPITADITLVAKWQAEQVEYTVALWMEKAGITGSPEGKGDYNYVTSVKLPALAGSTTTLSDNSLPNGIKNLFLGTTDSILKYGEFSSVENKEVLGNGLTVVNLYANRKTYTYTFNLGNSNNRSMTINGKEYKGGNDSEKYSIEVKYEMNITDVFPVQGAVAKFSKGFSSWERPANMKWQDSAGIASRRKFVDEGMLSKNGQDKNYTLAANWDAGKKEYIYRYFVEQIDGWPTGTTLARNNKTYVLMEEYNQTHTENLQAKNISGFKREKSSYTNYYFKDGEYNYGFPWIGEIHRCFFYSRITYPLTFNLMADDVKNENLFNKTISVAFDRPLAQYEPAETPERDGYLFAGWYRDADYQETFDFANLTMPLGGMIAYARWESQQNQLTFLDGRGGVEKWKQGVADGEYAENRDEYWQKDIFVPEKGVFIEWRYDIGGVPQTWSWEIPVYRDYTLYATWKTDGFTIAYNLAGGTGTTPQDGNSYDLNMHARVQDAPDVTGPAGGIFYDWKDEAGNLYYPHSIIHIGQTGNVVLTAQYVGNTSDLWRVTYHHNAGSEESKIIQVPKNNNIISLHDAIFTHATKKLVGWGESPGTKQGEADFHNFNAAYTVTGDTNLYGVWSSQYYSVTFNPGTNGRLNGETTFANIPEGTIWNEFFNGNTAAIPVVEPEAGYYFAGWSPKLPKDDSEINKDLTFAATYQTKYTLKLTAPSKELTYNGTEQIVEGYTGISAGYSLVTSKGIKLEAIARGTDVGIYPIAFNEIAENIRVIDENGKDVTHQFAIVLETGQLEIIPATLTVTADNQAISFGADVPAYTYKITGFVGKDNGSVVTGKPELSCPYQKESPAGEYTISVDVSKLSSKNYEFTPSNGKLAVGAVLLDIKKAASLKDTQKVYGTIDPNVGILFGFEKLPSGVTANMFDVSVTREAGENVGTYKITATVTVKEKHKESIVLANNELISDFIITQAVITVSLGAINLSYGDPAPSPSTYLPNIQGLVKNAALGIDDLYLANEIDITYQTEYVPGAPVKESGYPIKILASFKPEGPITRFFQMLSNNGGGAKNNYRIEAEESNLLNLEPKDIRLEDISFELEEYSKIYSQKDPAFKLEWNLEQQPEQHRRQNGLEEGFNFEDDFIVSFDREPGEDVGSYMVVAAIEPTEEAKQNYNIFDESPTAILIINPLGVKILVGNSEKIYGEKDPAPLAPTEMVYDPVENPLENFEKSAILFDLEGDFGENAGEYRLYATWIDEQNKNYTISAEEGTLTINPALLTVKAKDITIKQGEKVPALTYTIEGFVSGETQELVLIGQPQLSTNYAGNKSGAYSITTAQGSLKNLESPNYVFRFENGTLTVTAAATTPAEQPKPPASAADSQIKPAKTGDEGLLTIWLILFSASTIGVLYTVLVCKKKSKHQ